MYSSDTQGTLEFTLGGGVAVDVIDESSQNSRLYTGSSVADIPQCASFSCLYFHPRVFAAVPNL